MTEQGTSRFEGVREKIGKFIALIKEIITNPRSKVEWILGGVIFGLSVLNFFIEFLGIISKLVILIMGILAILVPYIARLLVTLWYEIIDTIDAIIRDLTGDRRSIKNLIYFTPIPAIILMGIHYLAFDTTTRMIEFQLTSNITRMEEVLEIWISNSKINTMKLSLIFDLLIILSYTVYFWFISREIIDQLENTHDDLKRGWKYNLLYLIDRIRFRQIMVVIAGITDVLENFLTFLILNDNQNIDSIGSLLNIITYTKFGSLILLIIITSLSLFSNFFFRFPIDISPNPPSPLGFHGTQLSLLAQMSSLAYFDPNEIRDDINGSSLHSPGGGGLEYEGFLETDDVTIEEKSTYIFDVDDDKSTQIVGIIKASTQGFVASRLQDDLLSIYVSFRGTESKPSDILLNLEFQHTAFTNKTELYLNTNSHGKVGTKIKVHKGFLLGYLSVEDKVRAGIIRSLLKHKEALKNGSIDKIELIFTGHSLGGAITTIAAAKVHQWLDSKIMDWEQEVTQSSSIPNVASIVNVEIEEMKELMDVLARDQIKFSMIMFNIGSPRVGNRNFKNYYANLFTLGRKIGFRYLRSRNDKEWAPMLPPVGYRHILPTILWTNKGNPKLRSEENRFFVSNIVIFTYFWVIVKEFSMRFVGKLFGKKFDYSEFIDDHNRYFHIYLFLKELSQTSADIFFEHVRDNYKTNEKEKKVPPL